VPGQLGEWARGRHRPPGERSGRLHVERDRFGPAPGCLPTDPGTHSGLALWVQATYSRRVAAPGPSPQLRHISACSSPHKSPSLVAAWVCRAWIAARGREVRGNVQADRVVIPSGAHGMDRPRSGLRSRGAVSVGRRRATNAAGRDQSSIGASSKRPPGRTHARASKARARHWPDEGGPSFDRPDGHASLTSAERALGKSGQQSVSIARSPLGHEQHSVGGR